VLYATYSMANLASDSFSLCKVVIEMHPLPIYHRHYYGAVDKNLPVLRVNLLKRKI